MSAERQKAWVCSICGYVHYGPEPPEECPICGADAGQFEPETTEEPAVATESAPGQGTRIVIVGAGIAGVSAAEAARKAAPLAEICLISNELELPYYRLNLTRYLAGEIQPEQFDLHPESWFAENNIRLICGVELTALDPGKKQLTLDTAETLPYDRLVLTTGARPFRPPVSGSQLGMVKTLRTRRDADEVLQNSRAAQVVCIGGGLLGLETAGALARQGSFVTVLENQAWLMPRQLNRTAAEIFQAFVESLGVTVRTAARVTALQGEDEVRAVLLDSGETLPADLVIFSAGVRSNTALASAAGLAVNQGILVDDAMRTSQPDIFAAGDAVEHAGVLYGTWAPAQAQGLVAGQSAAGASAAFQPLPRANTLKVLGIDLFSTGKIELQPGDALVEAAAQGCYQGFIFQNQCLAGAILLGDTSASAAVKKAVENRLDCAALLAGNPSASQVLAFVANPR